MFSWEFLRKSLKLARRVLANQRTSTRALLKQSEGSNPLPVAASLSRSSFGGSNNDDRKIRDALLKFLLRSVASGVVIVGSSLSFSNWYPSLVDKCSFVSFADSADDAAWVSSDDLLPHKKEKSIWTDHTDFFNTWYWVLLCIIFVDCSRFTGEEFSLIMKSASGCKALQRRFLSTSHLLKRLMVNTSRLDASSCSCISSIRVESHREGFLRGETVPGELHCAPSRFSMLFDTNSDGLISFSE